MRYNFCLKERKTFFFYNLKNFPRVSIHKIFANVKKYAKYNYVLISGMFDLFVNIFTYMFSPTNWCAG